MEGWSRLTGLAADALLRFPLSATPHTVERDLAVLMPDGVSLLGDRYRPADADGARPVVLIRTPYGRTGVFAQLSAGTLARRGFQVFLQSTRGTFGSGGQFRPFTSEREDGLATLDWLRRQPWCNGRIAMVGGSYLGHAQWAVVAEADPPLVSISPHIASARVAEAFLFTHGAPQIQTVLSVSAGMGRQERAVVPPVMPSPGLQRRIKRVLRRLPLQAADVAVAGAPVGLWRDFTAHGEPDDDFWTVADHRPEDLAQLPPTNMVTGWWDFVLVGQLADHVALRSAGVPSRLLVGPWSHGELDHWRALLRSDLAWLDHHLRGGPAPSGPPVRVFLQQADTWLDLEEWPPREAEEQVHHLGPGGVLTRERPTTAPASSTFTYDPDDPTPSVAGHVLQAPGKQADNRTLEARSDVLVFTSSPLDADLDVVGPVRARVHVRPELEHADVFVRVCDVDTEGVSRNVVDGIRRLDPRTVPAADVEVGDDGVLAVDVELFPTAYRFRAGHRLRVQVSGGAFPRFARNLGTGEPFAVGTAGRPGQVEVVHDEAHPSHVVLPVLH